MHASTMQHERKRQRRRDRGIFFVDVEKSGGYRVSVLTAESPPKPKVGESTPFPKVAGPFFPSDIVKHMVFEQNAVRYYQHQRVAVSSRSLFLLTHMTKDCAGSGLQMLSAPQVAAS